MNAAVAHCMKYINSGPARNWTLPQGAGYYSARGLVCIGCRRKRLFIQHHTNHAKQQRCVRRTRMILVSRISSIIPRVK